MNDGEQWIAEGVLPDPRSVAIGRADLALS